MPRVIALIAALSITVALAGDASAHETRRVGPYQLVVGWLNEPAYLGQPNAASVRVTDTRVTPTPRSVEGLERTLTIHVVAGGLSEAYTGALAAVAGQPGLYALHIVPTLGGSYAYRIRGKIGDLDVNETFESGPGRFNDVQSPAGLQYPAKVPAGAELAQRLEAIERDVTVAQMATAAAVVLALAALGLTLARRRGLMGSQPHRTGVVVVVGLASALAVASPIAAAPMPHLTLVTTDPPANSRLASSPAGVTVTFDKAVAARSTARLLRSDGSAVAAPVRVDGARVLLSPVSLAAGTYALHYSGIDPNDAHEAAGYIAFTVGADPEARLRGFELSATSGQTSARLTITPGRAGENSYTVTAAGVERATLRFEPADVQVGRSEQQLQPSGGGFAGKGMELALNGRTRITALLRRSGESRDTEVAFEVTVPVPSAATPVPTPSPTPLPAVATATPGTPTPLAAAASPAVTPDAGAGSGPVVPAVALAAAAALAYTAWRMLRAQAR